MSAVSLRWARPARLLIFAFSFWALPAGAQDADPPSGGGFSASDIKARYGWNFSEPGISEDVPKSILTFENAAGWSWGSHYLFVDVLRSWSDADANAKEVYGEWYPTMSLKKVLGWNPLPNLLLDVRPTVGLNTGVRSTGPAPFVVLPGVTLDLKVPAFQFLSLGAYAYVDEGRFQGHRNGCTSTTFQLTPSWSLPFSLAGAGLSFTGFADFIGSHGDCASQVLTQPELRLDISRMWGKPGVLQAGVQWHYWHNKYGVDGVDDSVVMPVLFWAF